jgi:PPOX class probable F420-dependent enzyme
MAGLRGVLTVAERDLLARVRRLILCTIAPDGSARPVPACFVVAAEEPAVAGEAGLAATVLYTPLDEKPKRSNDPHRLARVRDITARPSVTLLADLWDEDWTRLAWLRMTGTATLLEPSDAPGEHAAAVAALVARYPQYAGHDLAGRPMLRVVVNDARFWSARGDTRGMDDPV